MGREIGKHIAIDGKTLRGSFDTAAGRSPLHLVSAWASEARLTLGQVAVDAKSNEITAIPLLLELLDLKGATVTIDAMGCQKEIAQQIVDRGGDYVLALKGQSSQAARGGGRGVYRGAGSRRSAAGPAAARDGGNQSRPSPASRILRAAGTADAARLCGLGQAGHDRDGAAHHARRRWRETGEVSYFLSSLPPKVKRMAQLIRQHWSIESQLHWVLDVTFTEDASRIRKRHAPQTSAMLRRLAVSILSSDTSLKDSLRGKRYRACLSTDTLERILLSFVEK